MRIEKVRFQTIAVGIQIIAESPEDEDLLRCLDGLKARGNRPHANGMFPPTALYLSPRLPWGFAGDIIVEEDDASIMNRARQTKPA